ncbi:MAG: hypothetical protein FWD36_04965 [Treponema sp.]|nr:hypothetical protein [Treponema sp.]
MSNIKWGLVSGGIAFVLAFLTSLFAQVGFSIVLLRALLFAAIFFGIGIGARMLINMFIPDLLAPRSRNDVGDDIFASVSAGSRINITLDDPVDAALPEIDNYAPDKDDVGDFADLVSGASKSAAKPSPPKDIDQKPVKSYNEDIGDIEEFAPAPDNAKDEDSGEFSMDFGVFVPGSNETAESDSFMDLFSPFSGDGDFGGGDEFAPPERERRVIGNKPEKLEGDFVPREIAAGLRTVLEKDKKG